MLRTRKIKLNPSRQQRRRLDAYAAAARFTYNACVAEKNAESLARRLTQRIFDDVLAQEVAEEFAGMVFGNVLLKQSAPRPWSKAAVRRQRSDDADAVAAEVAANAMHNAVRRNPEQWKDSRSYRASQLPRQFAPGKLNYRFRDAFVTAVTREGRANPFIQQNPWLKETPKVVRQHAAFKAAAAFKSAFSNLRNGNITRFNVRFQSRKHQDVHGYTLGIEKAVSLRAEEGGGWSLELLERSIGKVRFFEKPPMDGKPVADCSIHKDGCGDYWLLVPFYKPKRALVDGPLLSIDPGGVVPFACYSPAGEAFFEGRDMKARVAAIQGEAAAVDKRISKAQGPLLEHLRLKRRKLFRRCERVRDDCHWKILKKWTDRYGGILLPHLPTRRLAGGLKAKSNREMFGISHWTFLQRAQDKCEERSCLFDIPNEAYTTKTCGRCGAYRQGITLDDRIFHCRRCGLRMNRDIAAARNICVRWLAETAGAETS